MLWWLAVDGGATRLIIHNGANPRCLEAKMTNSTSFRTNNSASLLNGIESGDNNNAHAQRYNRILLWRSLLSIMKRVDFSCVELKRHSRAICLPRDPLKKSQFCGCMIAVSCFGD